MSSTDDNYRIERVKGKPTLPATDAEKVLRGYSTGTNNEVVERANAGIEQQRKRPLKRIKWRKDFILCDSQLLLDAAVGKEGRWKIFHVGVGATEVNLRNRGTPRLSRFPFSSS